MAAWRMLAGLLGSRSNPDLRRGGREVGYAMVRRAPDVIDALRDTVDRADREAERGDDEFARGYRAALADALSGFAAALDARVEVERAAASLGRREVAVLRALCADARPQVRIARELAMAPHDVSRAAKRLRSAGLVQAYPGERETEQLHRVTALGRAVARELDVLDAARASGLRDDLAEGTPPVAETALYAESPAWSPASAPAPARAPAPRGGEIHELDTASDRWLAHAVDDDEES